MDTALRGTWQVAMATVVAGGGGWAARRAMAQTNTPVRGGPGVVALAGDPPTLNPAVSSGFPEQLLGCMVYQGLVQLSTNLVDVKPQLASRWSLSADEKTYTFDLVPAKWHDGRPFTAEDVRFSLLEFNAKYAPVFAPVARQIEKIEAPTASRVVVTLKQPFGPFLRTLTCAAGAAIMPRHVYAGANPIGHAATTTAPVGTGPFKLESWRRGDRVNLVRNPDYWEPGKPYLDAIVGKIIPQGTARTQALLAGEIDFVSSYFLSSSDHEVIAKSRKLKLVQSGFPPGNSLLIFNLRRKPLDDARVRQALFMATNREFLHKTAFSLEGDVGVTPFNSKFDWAAAEIDYRKLYPYNVARANQLLDEAGVARDASGKRFAVDFVISGDAPDRIQAALAVKSMWRQVGVDVNVVMIERTAQIKRVFADRDFGVGMERYTTFGDPALGIARTFTTAAIGRTFGQAALRARAMGFSGKSAVDPRHVPIIQRAFQPTGDPT